VRVLFAEHGAERRERQRALAAADVFWQSIEACAGSITPDHERALREVHPLLFLEAADDETDGIVIRSERRFMSPLVDAIVERRPPARRVHARRPALPCSRVEARFEDLLGGRLDGVRARAGFTRGHLLELVLHLPEAQRADTEAQAEALAQALLGERLVDDWVGAIDVVPAARAASSGRALPVLQPAAKGELSLAELPSAVSAAIEGLSAGLDSRPFHEQNELGWTMLECEPSSRDSAASQDDVLLVSTVSPELMKSFLRGEPFSSRRFSRAGERFAYLKLARGSTPAERWLSDRRALEDALDTALRQARAGCIFGAGLGLSHAYVDLAYADLVAGVNITREIARRAGAPRESWILFFDADWGAEWLGVWDETREPPGLEACD
jgi:hypothetical protein